MMNNTIVLFHHGFLLSTSDTLSNMNKPKLGIGPTFHLGRSSGWAAHALGSPGSVGWRCKSSLVTNSSDGRLNWRMRSCQILRQWPKFAFHNRELVVDNFGIAKDGDIAARSRARMWRLVTLILDINAY